MARSLGMSTTVSVPPPWPEVSWRLRVESWPGLGGSLSARRLAWRIRRRRLLATGRGWKLSQPSVSQALQDLGRAGYAGPLPRCGADATTYALTGSSRLVFG